MGCSGRTAHRRLRFWEELGIWDRLHADLLRLLRQANQLDPHLAIVDSVLVRAFGGGENTGPSPVDRRKKGSKHTLLLVRHGVPLAIRTAAANDSDHRQILHVVLEFPKVGGKRGRPKQLPDSLFADRGFESRKNHALLEEKGLFNGLCPRDPARLSERLGDEIFAMPTHICPTCAWHRQAYVVENGRVTGTWDIIARDRVLTI